MGGRPLGVLGIDAHGQLDFTSLFRGQLPDKGPEAVQLGKRVEHDVVAGLAQVANIRLTIPGGKGVHLPAQARTERFAAQPRLMRRAGAHPVELLRQQGKNRMHGKALEGEQHPAPGPRLHVGEDGEIALEQPLVHHVARRVHPRGVETEFQPAVHYNSTSFQGRPWLFRASMNGSGSNCSMWNTPWPCHLPVSIIMAPIMAGTPVVYEMAWDPTSS